MFLLSHFLSLPSEKVSTLKGKNLLPWKEIRIVYSNSFHFRRVLVCWKANRITKVASFVQNGMYPAPLTLCMLGNFACFFVVCGFFLI